MFRPLSLTHVSQRDSAHWKCISSSIIVGKEVWMSVKELLKVKLHKWKGFWLAVVSPETFFILSILCVYTFFCSFLYSALCPRSCLGSCAIEMSIIIIFTIWTILHVFFFTKMWQLVITKVSYEVLFKQCSESNSAHPEDFLII